MNIKYTIIQNFKSQDHQKKTNYLNKVVKIINKTITPPKKEVES